MINGGLVRDLNEGASVGAMTLEHYPGMTERHLEKLEAEARARVWEEQYPSDRRATALMEP